MAAPDTLRVAFQGELGSFSEEACAQLYGRRAAPVPQRDFADAVQAVLLDAADVALLPVENTIVGSIVPSYDAIDAAPSLHAVAETVVDVHHCLLGCDASSMVSVRTVLSHPVALQQCAEFFRRYPGYETHAVYDTAGAAQDVANLQDPTFAAVASRRAAERYGLRILAADIEDRHDNQTRFLAFAREPAEHPKGTPVRTTVAFTTEDAPGALLLALEPVARFGLNLRRLESRPGGAAWTYRFFLEFDHEVGNLDAERALAEMARAVRQWRRIGTYARWNPGRRGSIGWKTPLGVPVIPDSAR